MNMMEVYRVTVFVPQEHADELKLSICKANPLRIGGYEKVMWSTHGVEEQFTPILGSNPTVGEINKSLIVDSVRLEFCIPRDKSVLECVIEDAIFPTHPWEVPAIMVDESIIPFKE